MALLDSTLLGLLLDGSEEYDVSDDYRETTLYALNNLRNIPVIEEPSFTFAHLTVPHRPYIFTTDDATKITDVESVEGEIIDEGLYTPYMQESNIPAYLEQN